MFIHAGREPTAPWTTEIHTMPLTVFYVSQSGKNKTKPYPNSVITIVLFLVSETASEQK